MSPGARAWLLVLPAAGLLAPYLLGFHPGVLTYDSLDQWRQVTAGPWVDVHPVAHTALVWVAAKLGSPAWLVAAQQLALAAGVVALGRAVHAAGAPLAPVLLASVAVLAAPSTGLFSVAIWKDVPYAAAVLVWTAALVQRLAGRGALGPLIAGALAVVLLRQNGFVVVAAVGLALALRGQRPVGLGLLLGGPGLWLALRLVVWPALGVGVAPASATLPVLVHDVVAIYHAEPLALSEDEAAALSALGDRRGLYRRYDCATVHPLLQGLDADVLQRQRSALRAAWQSMVRRAPGAWLQHRACAGALAWRPTWRRGEPRHLVPRSIEPNELGLSSAPWRFSDALNAAVDLSERSPWDHLLWRAPGWIAAALLALGLAARRRRELAPLLAVPLGLAASVLLANPAQDARYMAAAGLVSVCLLPLAAARAPRRPGTPTDAVTRRAPPGPGPRPP